MELVNLTPHALVILTPTGPVNLPAPLPGTRIPRVEVEYTQVAAWPANEDVPLFRADYGFATDLPNERPGVLLIVSAMVRESAPNRGDLVSPGRLVRADDGPNKGQPIGCEGLVVNWPAYART